MTVENPPVDLKVHLADADTIIDGLPWRLGTTEAQRKAARGKVAGLTHQIAGLLAGGWSAGEIRAALADAPGAVEGPDAGAQERLWRKALKRAKSHRQPST